MLTVVLAVAVVGIILLAAAVLMDSSIVALVVIVVALAGLVLLAREWLADRRQSETTADGEAGNGRPPNTPHEESLEPDEFEPDVPYEETDDSPSGQPRA